MPGLFDQNLTSEKKRNNLCSGYHGVYRKIQVICLQDFKTSERE